MQTCGRVLVNGTWEVTAVSVKPMKGHNAMLFLQKYEPNRFCPWLF